MATSLLFDALGFCLIFSGTLMGGDAIACRNERDLILTGLHTFVAVLLGVVGIGAAAV